MFIAEECRVAEFGMLWSGLETHGGFVRGYVKGGSALLVSCVVVGEEPRL